MLLSAIFNLKQNMASTQMLQVLLFTFMAYLLHLPLLCYGSRSISQRGNIFSIGGGRYFVRGDWHGQAQRKKRDIDLESSGIIKPGVDIDSLAITSKVMSHFAQVEYASVLTNDYTDDKEAVFTVYIPETAFISNFTMLIDGKLHVADVGGKEEVDKKYEEAKERNVTAGRVRAAAKPPDNLRFKDIFTVSLNVAGQSSVQCVLSYMELLERRLGKYEHSISIRPNQVVKNLSTDVFIYEPQGFASLKVSDPISEEEQLFVTIDDVLPTVRHIRYQPSEEAQLSVQDQKYIDGDFVVNYDVVHSNDVGFVQTNDGYFVHYFSPSGYAALNKNVIFVIDRSGSMSGEKIKQTRQSMLTILNQLRPGDLFQLILFSNKLEYWSYAGEDLVAASTENVQNAKEFIREHLVATGGTNINDGLVQACINFKGIGKWGANMIVFLTDGQPTSGVTSVDAIVQNVMKEASQRVSIFSLGYGFDVNFELLQMLSYATGGFARRIYEGTDASKQLKNFFAEINNPVMFDVNVQYGETAVDMNSLTNHIFPQYFEGSEHVISGKLKPDAPSDWEVNVMGQTTTNINMKKIVQSVETTLVGLPPEVSTVYQQGFLEKLWVYMRIKDLLRQKLIATSEEDKDNLHKEALSLALTHRLVTPITSMIIVQDQDDRTSDREMYEDFAVFSKMPASGPVMDVGMRLSKSSASVHVQQCSMCFFLISLFFMMCLV